MNCPNDLLFVEHRMPKDFHGTSLQKLPDLNILLPRVIQLCYSMLCLQTGNTFSFSVYTWTRCFEPFKVTLSTEKCPTEELARCKDVQGLQSCKRISVKHTEQMNSTMHTQVISSSDVLCHLICQSMDIRD